jgi:hypothetical protein
MRPSLWAPALTALAVSAQQQQMPTEVQTFEIDNVFPRNETYKTADVFPIVFALQNMTAMASIGPFQLTWSIMPFGEGRRPSGLVPDDDEFMLAGSSLLPPNNTAPSDGTTYLVDYTNATEWISYAKDDDYRFMLQWSLHWPGLDEDLCDRDLSSARASLPDQGSVMFNVQRTWGENGRWKGPIHDALVTTECPQLGSVVEIAPNATTPECPAVQKRLEREGNPCGAQPDEAAVSSIMSQVSSMAAPTSTTAAPSSTSSGGVGPARTVQTALAAACLLCGLAL